MSNKFISKGQRNVCVTFVKYYPVLMQVIMLASIFDEFYPFSITNWLYPIGEEAVSYLNVTSKRFYEYRKAKLVPDPVKIKGFPKPLYTKVMLDEAIKTISSMSEREIYMRILNAKSRESRAKERRGA